MCLGAVQVADRHGERVGGVIGSGNVIQVQQGAHHLLDLVFIRASIPGHGLFYLQGGVFSHRYIRLGQGE